MADTPEREKRTKLDRNLVSLRATAEQCEAAHWFWTREIWAREGVRDPVLDGAPSRFNAAGQEEAVSDELTWRLSRAETHAILRTFYDWAGWGYWSLATGFLVYQEGFREIGAAYYPGLKKTQQYEQGRRICTDLLEKLTEWLAEYRKERRKTANRTEDGHPWPRSPRAVIVESV